MVNITNFGRSYITQENKTVELQLEKEKGQEKIKFKMEETTAYFYADRNVLLGRKFLENVFE